MVEFLSTLAYQPTASGSSHEARAALSAEEEKQLTLERFRIDFMRAVRKVNAPTPIVTELIPALSDMLCSSSID